MDFYHPSEKYIVEMWTRLNSVWAELIDGLL
jgi:hypothetical protein